MTDHTRMTMDLSDYQRLVRDLGTWAETFGVRADARPRIVLRGATESSTFIVGDTSVYRFGKSLVVQRRLPSGGEAYFVLRKDGDAADPRLVRQGVIGRDVGGSAMAGLTNTLTAAAARTKQTAGVDGATEALPALV
jgi:hypothetical protein